VRGCRGKGKETEWGRGLKNAIHIYIYEDRIMKSTKHCLKKQREGRMEMGI
jgi:hypothetical protein